MISRNDPRVRRAIDELARGVEAANQRTQENIFTFTQSYISPCLSSLGEYARSCTAKCCIGDEERRRRHLARSRGHAESSFDFYDDWEADETDALLGLDSEPGPSRQPQRRRQMSYGTRGMASESDTKKIHSSSYFGFLERFPRRLGARGFTYKPSIADLQDHPGIRRQEAPEDTPLLDDAQVTETRGHKRNRSGTHSSTNSGLTTDSFSSRGDIFPSDDEMDDAVPIDDELALHLERRTTGSGLEDSIASLSRKAPSTHSLPAMRRKKKPSLKSHSSSSTNIRQASSASLSSPHVTTEDLTPPVAEADESTFNAAALPRFT
jgi:hypothetical protein